MVNTAKALKKLWTDKVSVEVYDKVNKPNGSTGFGLIPKHKDISCRLSYSNVKSAREGDVAQIAQVVKLFLDPNIEIPAGSKLTVKHRGKVLAFERSGEPAIYTNHQEIVLAPYKRMA